MASLKKSPWKIIGVILIIVIGIVVFQKFGLLTPIKNIMTSVLRPVQTFFSTASHRLQGLGAYFQNNRQTVEENATLHDQVATLTVENEQLKSALADSGLLKEEIQFIQEHQYQSVAAKVIGTSSDNYSQVILINQGEKAGIHKGYPVVVDNGVLIGKIIDAGSNISKILLLNDNHSQISAIVNNETKSPGLVNGRYSLSLLMELIPQDQTIAKDQTVVTSGLEQDIPPGLLIGTINTINKKEGELFQQASIEPSASYRNISIVSVILPST